MASNDVNDHTICGDAEVLVPPQFKEHFGKRHNVKAPQLACDLGIFKATFRKMAAALPDASWQFAMKTNDHLALIATAIQEGHGLDCSSLGEIMLVLEVAGALGKDAKAVMAKCSYGNPNKTTSDIRQAYALGVRMFSVDCTQEIDKIAAVAPGASLYLRTYVDATQATAISVFTNKFGAPDTTICDLSQYAQKKGLVPDSVGLSVGGGQTDPGAFAMGVKIAGEINRQCREAGVSTMTGITFCGGLPAPGAPGAPSFETIGNHIRDACAEHGIAPKDVTFEPGRSLATTCGIIEAKVITLKEPVQGDDKYTLVLNIGVFKGLFEMERTNLTYKLAAYGTADGLVPCRIVDDTCDSKGVCFKEKTVMMPKSLKEGSLVYFLNTGSYTTAYVMEGFNRTLGLVSACFPDPFAQIGDLPEWLKGVPTPGEAAHPGKDFKALRQAYGKLTTDEKRRQFLIDNLPGAGTFGISLLPSHQVKRFRQLNSAIVSHAPGQPGAQHRMGFQPQQLFQEMWEGWVANSASHTANTWKDYATIKTAGPAKAYLCFQNQYRTSVKHCTLMHATLVIVPEKKEDGPPTFVEVNYNPYAVDGLDEDVLDGAFGKALRNEKVYRNPEGQFEQLMAGDKLRPEFANADLVWAGSLRDCDPLSVYWPEATAKDGTKRPINLEGALVFDLNVKQHSDIAGPVAFLIAAYGAGYGASNRSHVDRNSCILTTIRLLTRAMLGRDAHLGEDWSTDRLIEHMAGLAHRRLWTDKAGHGIRNLKKFEDAAKEIGAEEFVANIQSILRHPTMMRAHGDENAYNTDYMTNVTVPHPDYDAQQLYEAAAQLALTLLEQKASNIGAI